jgi:hypothetical protein
MFRILLLVATIVLFVIAPLGAFGSITDVNYSGLLAVELACLAAQVLDFENVVTSRRKTFEALGEAVSNKCLAHVFETRGAKRDAALAFRP